MAGTFLCRALPGLSRSLLGNSLVSVAPLWQLLGFGPLALVASLSPIPYSGLLALVRRGRRVIFGRPSDGLWLFPWQSLGLGCSPLAGPWFRPFCLGSSSQAGRPWGSLGPGGSSWSSPWCRLLLAWLWIGLLSGWLISLAFSRLGSFHGVVKA